MPIEITGTEVLLSTLEKMVPANTDVDEYLTAAARPILDEMVRMAPVGETGNLKKSIKIGPLKTSARGRQVSVGIHRKDFPMKEGEYYPAYVEYGHKGPHPAPPHPFIRPAYDLKKSEALEIMKKSLAKLIK